MPTKLLTLVIGVAGGIGIALAVSVAADRGIENRHQSERRRFHNDGRESVRSSDRQTYDRDDERYMARGEERFREDDRRNQDWRSDNDGVRGQIADRDQGRRPPDVGRDGGVYEVADRRSTDRSFDRGPNAERRGASRFEGHPPVRSSHDGWRQQHSFGAGRDGFVDGRGAGQGHGQFAGPHSWHGQRRFGHRSLREHGHHRHAHPGWHEGHHFAHHGHHGAGHHHHSWRGGYRFGERSSAGYHGHGHHHRHHGHHFAHHGHHGSGHHHSWHGRHRFDDRSFARHHHYRHGQYGAHDRYRFAHHGFGFQRHGQFRHPMGAGHFGVPGHFGFGMNRFAGRFGRAGASWSPGAMHGMAMSHSGFFRSFGDDRTEKISLEEVVKAYGTADKDGDGSVSRHDLIKAILAASASKSATDKAATTDSAKDAGRTQDYPRPGEGTFRSYRPFPGPGSFGPFPGRGPRGPGFAGAPMATMLMNRFDKDHKGKLTKDDLPAPVWDRISKADANGDGTVTKDELETYFKNRGPRRPDTRSPAKPDQKPDDSKQKQEGEKPKDQPVEKAQPQAQVTERESPADALTAANVAAAR